MAEGERRLAAIMFTDIVGYTALARKSETDALRLVEDHRQIIRPIISRHNGREIKTMGDAFLVEFSSALEAARCAFDIQQSLHESNLNRSAGERVLLRVGVHLGDVIHSQKDVYGDAVNIASRIEPLAEPGGVCVTVQVYDQIKNKFEFPFSSLGKKELKNVSESTEVLRMVLPWQRVESKARFDEHRLAVLPLSSISPDPNDAYFADGMTEELITVLSQLQDLRVIARTSVDQYKVKEKRVSKIAEELQVGSLIEGSVRKAGERIRVTLQLINANNEEHIWSESYDRRLDDIFAIQTDIAKHVAKSLKVKLLEGEVERIESRAPENPSAYSAYLKGRTLLVSRVEADLKAAKELFESAIAQDPAYAPAYSGLADAYILLGEYSSAIPFSTANRQARELVSKALGTNPDLAEARATLGLLLAQEYEFTEAEKEFRRAISLNPSYSNAHLWFGQFVLAFQGRYRESLEELNLAELADPMSIAVLVDQLDWLLLYTGNLELSAQKVARANQLYPEHQLTKGMNIFFQIVTRNYSRAIELCLEAIGRDETPHTIGLMIWLVEAYSAIGNREEARKWLAKLRTVPERTPYRSAFIAYAHAGLGELNEFFTWARRASEEKAINLGLLRLIDKEMPPMRNIRQDPRFIELFKKVGLEA